MPNILITNYCNRECRYCFAKDKVNPQKKNCSNGNRSITLKDIDFIIKFLKISDHKIFSILGGEPTLHPHFSQIVDKALENDFKIRVFTNGLMKRETQKYLFRNNIDIILNINEPEETPDSHLLRLESLYENLGPNIYPGFNIYREDFDFSFIYDLIDKYYMARSIRLGISQPIINQENASIRPEQYKSIGKKLVHLSGDANKRDIRLNFDCGFVLCMFDQEDIGKLVYANSDLQFVCGPTIDIGPDMNIWHCFPLSSIMNKQLSDFDDLESVVRYYAQITKAFSNVGMYSECSTCPYLRRGQCSGGCISHKMENHKEILKNLII